MEKMYGEKKSPRLIYIYIFKFYCQFNDLLSRIFNYGATYDYSAMIKDIVRRYDTMLLNTNFASF